MSSFAFFDFDGTLLPGDSITAFLQYARKMGKCGKGDLLKAAWAGLLCKTGLLGASAAKERAMGFLSRLSPEENRQLCKQFCEDVLVPALYEEGLREMAQRKKEGCRVVLVTASTENYMQYMQPYLRYDRLLATPVGPEGSLGENCRGAEKVVRIRAMLQETGEAFDYRTSHAYGDSLSDRFMLELCANRHCVNPGPSLRRAFGKKTGVRFEHWQ